MNDWIALIALIVGIAALIVGVLSLLDTKRIRRELDGSLGTPAVQINWGIPAEEGVLPCRVTAVFNRVSGVRLKVGKEERKVDELARGQGKELKFNTVPEGTKFNLCFKDPVDNRNYKRDGIIRYGQLDF